MVITSIEVERFMGIRRLSIPLAKTLQIVAGPNNAGKTTLLRALEFFFDPGAFVPSSVQPRNSYYSEEGSRSLTRVRVYLGDLTEDEENACGTAVNRRGQLWVEARLSRAGHVSYSASRGADGEVTHVAVCSIFHLVHVPAVRVGRSSDAHGEHQRLAATVRDVLVKVRPGRETALQRDFRTKSEALLGLIKSVLDSSANSLPALGYDASDLEFAMPSLEQVLGAILGGVDLRTHAGSDLFLRDEGTGFQSLLSLGVLSHVGSAQARRGTCRLFLVEEPEAFLHPQFQRLVAAELKVLAQGAQVLVTTHSPVIVDTADIRHVCRLPRDTDGLEYAWTPDELNEVEAGRLSVYCDVRNSELIFADRVVLCEGPTDEGVIRALLEVRFGSPSELGVAIIGAGSIDKIEYLVRVARRFRTPHFVVVDKDCYSGNSRATLQKIAKANGSQFSQQELQRLHTLGQQRCSTLTEASDVRDEANEILSRGSIHALGADMEFAVATSYQKAAALQALGLAGEGHLSDTSAGELAGLTGTTYFARLRQLVGSKGWNTEPSTNSNKPKPHVLPAVVRRKPGQLRAQGDLRRLADRLAVFLELNDY